jgi:hypothetical protein
MADNVVQKVIWKLADNMGKIGSLALYVPLDTGTDPITVLAGGVSLFNAISDSIIVGQVSQTADDTSVGSAASNTYDIRDKLDVEYVGSQNDHHTVHIGDPDPAIFQTGNSELVDPTNTAWLALKSAIETNVKDKLGNAVKVIRGYRQRSRNLRASQRFL